MLKDKKIAVLGGGSWATAIIKILANQLNEINWYMRDVESANYINTHHINPKYLSSVNIDTQKVKLFTDIDEIVNDSDVLILAIPSAFLEKALNKLKTAISDKIILSAIKGIIPDKNIIITEYLNQFFDVPLNSIGIISGPCHAEEVALERLSYLTFASRDIRMARQIADLFECSYIKTSISDDVFGTEYSSVLKNIAAIAAGICHGLGYGDNFLSVLISNSIQEIKRFVDTIHPNTRDINRSVYLGDLIVTAYSQFSRNRTFGTMIGKGYSLHNTKLEMNMIAEGYYSSYCIHEINRLHNVIMPIADAVYNVLYDGISPAIEMKLLSDNLV